MKSLKPPSQEAHSKTAETSGPGDFIPRRVVSLQPSVTVIFERLGLLDRLVACTKYCLDLCPGIKTDRVLGARSLGDGSLDNESKLIVADSWTATSEQILRCRPDLVIASVPYQVEAVAEIMRAGITFLGLAPHSMADVYSDVFRIASIMGCSGAGTSLITGMQEHIAAVSARSTEAAGRPLVYCEEWGKPLIHSQPWVAELVEAAGGRFLGMSGKQTDAATIRAANPEVIIAAWCGAGERAPLEKIIRDRDWGEITAAEQGAVFCVRDDFLNTPAPTLLHGLDALACAIHPEIFGDAAAGLRRIGTGVASPAASSELHRAGQPG